MTDTILEAVQIKEKLYKTWQKSRSEDDHTAYKIKRKSVTFAIKSAKDKLEGTYIYVPFININNSVLITVS